jgi:hypothetical protein
MNQRHAGYMPDAPQWGGKIFRPAKAGKGFRWETADGAQDAPRLENGVLAIRRPGTKLN